MPTQAFKKKRKPSKCHCGADILFMKTSFGKWIPVEYSEFLADERTFDIARMRPHIVVCPNREEEKGRY